MKTFVLVPLAATALIAAGCADTGPDTQSSSREPREQPEYRTGSNLPVRAPRPKTKEEREQAQRDAEQAQRDAEKILRPGT